VRLFSRYKRKLEQLDLDERMNAPLPRRIELALEDVENVQADIVEVVQEYRFFQSRFGLLIDPSGNILMITCPEEQRPLWEVRAREIVHRLAVLENEHSRALSVWAGLKDAKERECLVESCR
jgi:hypothetical protein